MISPRIKIYISLAVENLFCRQSLFQSTVIEELNFVMSNPKINHFIILYIMLHKTVILF